VSVSLQNQQAALDYAPLLHWDNDALAFVANKVAQALQQWREAWVLAAQATLGSPLASAFVLTPATRTGRAFRLHAEASSAAAWLVGETLAVDGAMLDAAQLVGHPIYGSNARTEPDSIAAVLCREALAHLASALRSALALDADSSAGFTLGASDPLPHAAFREWAGGVRVTMPGFDGLALFLSGPAVARLHPPKRALAPQADKAALTPPTAAAASAQVVLKAQLRPVALTLGQIKSLQLGDIVLIPHPLDLPLQVMTDTGTHLCEAYLGQEAAHRSLELLPAQAHSATT
jgi:hypothetical protein